MSVKCSVDPIGLDVTMTRLVCGRGDAGVEVIFVCITTQPHSLRLVTRTFSDGLKGKKGSQLAHLLHT